MRIPHLLIKIAVVVYAHPLMFQTPLSPTHDQLSYRIA